MNRNRTSLIVIGLFLLIVGFVFFYQFVMGISGKATDVSNNRQYSELTQELSDPDLDYTVYWIGDAPESLASLSAEEGINGRIIIIPFSEISEDTMPILWRDIHMREYDSEGNLIRDIEPRDYAEKMFIVVNSINGIEGLDDERNEIIRNCIAENKIPVVILGKSYIDQFRNTLMLPVRNYGEYSSMLYVTESGSVDNPISGENTELMSSGRNGGRDALFETLRFILDYWTEEVN